MSLNNFKIELTKLCTGCGTCVSLCPKDSISLTIDKKKGLYLPHMNQANCSDCGICYKVCPGHEVDFNQLNLDIFDKSAVDKHLGSYLKTYVGHSKNCDIRYSASSGGIITQVLIYALKQGIIDGALVTRMRLDRPLEPESFIASTEEEIKSSMGSKYCPVPANLALRDIIDAEDNKRFAVVGLPCHIHGIRKAERISKNLKKKISLHLGIFCATTVSFHGVNNLLEKHKICKDDITKLDYRGEGWPGGMTIKFQDGSTKFLATEKYYDKSFYMQRPYRCLLCYDFTNELADISFGDAWHKREVDNIGESIIITRTKESEDLITQMLYDNAIDMTEMLVNDVKSTQNWMYEKKNYLKARMRIFNLTGANMPKYNVTMEGPSMNAYPNAILCLFLNYLAERNYLEFLRNLARRYDSI